MPPSFFPFDGTLLRGDTLFLRSQGTKLATLNYTARFTDLEGTRQWNEPLADQTTTDDRTIQQNTYTVQDDRKLVFLFVSDQLEAGIGRGEIIIEVYLARGNNKPLFWLVTDYLQTDHYPQWPGTILENAVAEAIYTENVNIANQAAAGAGAIERLYVPANQTQLEILGASIVNRDTVARRALAAVDTGTNDQDIVTLMDDTTVDAGNSVQFPVAVNISATLGGAESLATGAVKIRGTKRLRMRVLAVADGQDAEFSVSLRVTGRSPAIPTRTAVGQGTEVVTVNHSVMDFLED